MAATNGNGVRVAAVDAISKGQRHRHWLALLLPLFVAACSGGIGSAPGTTGSGPTGGPGPTTGTTGAGGSGPGTMADGGPGMPPGPGSLAASSRAMRLSNVQWERTVQDL